MLTFCGPYISGVALPSSNVSSVARLVRRQTCLVVNAYQQMLNIFEMSHDFMLTALLAILNDKQQLLIVA